MSELDAVEREFEETVRGLVTPAVSMVATQVETASEALRFDVNEYREACERQGELLGDQLRGLKVLLGTTRDELAAHDRSDALDAQLGHLQGVVLEAQRVVSLVPEQFLASQEKHFAEKDLADRGQAQALMDAVTAQLKALDDPTLRLAVAQLGTDTTEGNKRLAAMVKTTRRQSNLLLALASVSIVLALVIVWLVVSASA